MIAPASSDRAVLRAGHPLPEQRSPSRARRGRVADAMAQSATLDNDLSGKTSAPIGRTGEERVPSRPVSCHTWLVQHNWWYIPLLSGIFALVGVLIAQGVVLYLAHRNDKRRSEPELLRHCAEFSAACGKLKRELSLREHADRNLDCIGDLDSSYDALIIIGTPEIEEAAERFIGLIPLVFDAETTGNTEEHNKIMRRLFWAHTEFIDAVRAHFNRPKKIYMALPMLDVPNPQVKPSKKWWRVGG
jgi:hypothetical protein